MAEQVTIEERLTVVEKDLAELKGQFASHKGEKSWIEKVAGTFKGDSDFGEIVRLGREFRKSVQ